MLSKIRRFIRALQSPGKKDLSYLFSHADPDLDLESRIEWVASLVEWIRDSTGQTTSATRVKFILQWLDRHPEGRLASARVIQSVIRETDSLSLFTEVGLPSQPSFGREFRRRLFDILLPAYSDPRDMADVQSRLFYDDEDPERFEKIPPELLDAVLSWIRTGLPPDEALDDDWRRSLLDASRVLAARCLAITLRPDFLHRSTVRTIDENPFMKMSRHLDRLNERDSGPGIFESLHEDLGHGRRLLTEVRAHLELTGVSVDLVYQIDRVRNDLTRLNRMIGLLERAHRHEDLVAPGFAFWIELLRGHRNDGDFAAIFRKHIGLLSKKIVERTGASGEHYITQTSSEYWHLLLMALGGGVLTAVTAFLKYAHHSHDTALFVEFAYNATNYSVSFLVMHFLGFKLATKQPSMTAAALAGKLKEEGGQADDDAFVDEIARISRGQFAAVVGNLAAVIPAALLINWVFMKLTGSDFFEEKAGLAFLDSINPFISGTLIFGAVTGVVLWASSMTAGWLENASVFARVPEILRAHPFLRWVLGRKRAERVADAYLRNIAGITGSVALGVFLAAVPMLGRFFGVPLQAYHVTLTTGALTYSASAIDWSLRSLEPLVYATIGIAVIGLLNFGVSFALALSVAVRARDLPKGRVYAILRRAFAKGIRRPQDFLFPVRTTD